MTTYKEISGKQVKNYSSDPANDAEGQVWYNSTSGTFKSVLATGAWSSGANMISAKRFLAAAGTQTAGLAFGGQPNPTNPSEEYNGSGWSTGGNMTSARTYLAGCGTQAAALAFGGNSAGSIDALTEEYNGSSWSEQNDLNTARAYLAGMGTQTAALAAGGRDGPSTLQAVTEEYNGTSWTEQNDMSTARRMLAGAGTQTAGLVFGGGTPNSDATEEYDGTSWTAGGTMNTARRYLGGLGIQTSALAIGGTNTSPANASTTVEEYDGSTWTTSSASLATGRGGLAAAGNTTAGLAIGGYNPDFGTAISATEEYNFSTTVTTGAAFSSGGNMPDATSKVADGGTQTAAVQGGGQKNNPDSQPTSSSEYNGTSWTGGNALPATYGAVTSATGTQTALITGGANNPTPGGTFEYDGTNWTAAPQLGTARYGGKTLGTQTAAVHCGGRVSPPTLNNVEEWDGSSWTAVTAMPIATRAQGGFGTQTAGVVVSGFQGPSSPPVSPTGTVSRAALGFDYDGSSWTAGTSALIAGANGGAAGIQTVAIYLAGENPALSPGAITTSQTYDGTSYTTNASVIRSRATAFGITSSRTAEVGTAAMIFGGGDPAATPNDTNATEEYNAGTTAINTKTLTSS